MSTARQLARRVLQRVDEGAWATLTLAGELERAKLSAADRGLATELVYGVLRQRARLDHAIGAYATSGLKKLDAATLLALRVGAYQILFLRTPAHAVVNDAVGAVKKLRGRTMAGVCNAILRRLSAEREPALPSGSKARLQVEHSAPEWLVAHAEAALGAEAPRFLEAINRPAPVWIRAHLPRFDRERLRARLSEELPSARFTAPPFPPEALCVEGAQDLFRTRAYAEGGFVAQDLAAQLIGHLAAPRPGARVLDACAGIGGKTTHMAALVGPTGSVVAADRSARKLELARDHCHRLGLSNVETVEIDLTSDLERLGQFEVIVLDAPCSALGVLRRHPEAKWRPGPDLGEAARVQTVLLARLAPLLSSAPDACLVYSVCSFCRQEGQGVVESFLAAHPAFAPSPLPLALATWADGPFVRTWPHRHDCDAFFAARLALR